MMKKRTPKNNRGNALIMALVAISTLAILLSAIGIYVVAENKDALSQERNTQAYYIARAGAVAATEWITGMDATQQAAFEALSFPLTSDPEPFGDGEFIVTIDKHDTTLTLTSVGRVLSAVTSDGNRYVENSVSTVLTRSESNATISSFDKAVYAKNKLVITGSSSFEGGAGIGSSADDAIDLSWSAGFDALYLPVGANPSDVIKSPKSLPLEKIHYENVPEYPPPVIPPFPTGLFSRGNLELTGNKTATIDSEDSGHYNRIIATNSGKLTIDTSKGDVTLAVNQLSVEGSGKIDILGDNKVYLYVKNFSLIASGGINNNRLNGEERLIFYYYGSSFSAGGNTDMQATMYIDCPEINITNSGKLVGDIITTATKVTISGAGKSDLPRVLYAPNAKASVTNSGSVYGTLIANEVELLGNASVVLKTETIDPTIPIEVEGGAGKYSQQYWK
ncbi:MAG: DUF7305 domain-containing protein [Christensenellales bacterium]|jgi:hypothetical protein